MIYGQDEPVLFPVADLYDSGMMGAYLSAVKDQYQRGLKDYDDFVSKYGDFTSPIQKDVEYWNNNTMGPLADAVNQMYANGIDPTRSPEARAVLSRMMRNIPYAKLANMRQSAENAKEYLKSRAQMMANGQWDPDFEKFVLGGNTLEGWDTNTNGMWTRMAPSKWQTLNQYTSHIFDNMEPLYKGTKNGYRYVGIDRDDLLNAANPFIQGMLRSDLGSYYYNNALNQVRLENPGMSKDDLKAAAIDRFKENIADANRERLREPMPQIDPYEQMAVQNRYAQSNMRLQAQLDEAKEQRKHENAMELQALKNQGKSGSGRGGNASAEGYSYTNSVYYDGIANALASTGTPIYALKADSNGRLSPAKDSNGKYITKSVADASQQELEYAAKDLVRHQRNFSSHVWSTMWDNTPQSKTVYGKRIAVSPHNQRIINAYIDAFGTKDAANGAYALFPGHKVQEDGSIRLTRADIKSINSPAQMTAKTAGNRANGKISSHNETYRIFKDMGKDDKIDNDNTFFIPDQTSIKNVYTVMCEDGRIHIFRKGRIQYNFDNDKDTDPARITDDVWMDTGIVSNQSSVNVVTKGKNKKRYWSVNASLDEFNGTSYRDMDAAYLKRTGSQKQANVALTEE